MVRGPDPSVVIAAYNKQWSSIRSWLDTISDDEWLMPSVLDGWRVAELVAHFGLVADSIPAAAETMAQEPPLRLGEYLATYADAADQISTRTRAVASEDRERTLFSLDSLSEQVDRVFADGLLSDNPAVRARRGPIVWGDFLRSRCIELAVHADDLGRSVNRKGPVQERPCLQISTRALVDVLGWRAPGRSVEMRVPPFAAVQCVSGPRHKRGTPGAVVETDPITFLRLAAGRISWREGQASGDVIASGLRTDLSPYLPLF
jgi:uncharacterized protein (TIGR03083 family)